MSKDMWKKFLDDLEKLQIFSLSTDFDKTGVASSSTSIVQTSSYGDALQQFLRSWTHSPWSRVIMEQIRTRFIGLPRNLFRSALPHMPFGYRFYPGGPSTFSEQVLRLPQSFDRLTDLSHSLGLTYNTRALSPHSLYPYTSLGGGLRGMLSNKITKILVEVINYYQGSYWRLLVLVYLGVGCTVWYAHVPGSSLYPPECSLFEMLNYEPFYHMDYHAPGFERACFVEKNEVTAAVAAAFENEIPFRDIPISASGLVFTAVGVGVMLGIFITAGIIPNFIEEINTISA